MTTWIKVCGITRREDAEAALHAGADLLGFVFVPGTPRAVRAENLGWLRELGTDRAVGVFRDAPVAEVVETRSRLGLAWVQLHGDEPDDSLRVLGHRVLRRVATAGGVDWRRVARLAGRCLPLIDPGAGDGVVCDWEALEGRPPGLRFGIAGGLEPSNVARAMRRLRPALVDVSSGVEAAPGIKDPALVAAFVRAVREADAGETGTDVG